MTPHRMRLLCVVNYRLPESDYRVRYAELSDVCDVFLALPVQPHAFSPDRFVEVGFGEGVEWRDLNHFMHLAIVLFQRRHRLDCVHFFSTKLVLIGPMVARLAGIRSLVTVTGLGRTFSNASLRYRLLRGPYHLLLATAIRLSRGALFQNYGDLETTREEFPWARSKCWFIGSGTQVGPAVARKATLPLRVLLVSRLLESKGVNDFVEVARSFFGDNRIHFTLIGPASRSEPELRDSVLAAAAKGELTYLGQQDAARVQQAYRVHDILYFPSRSEGMSRVLLEAGAAAMCPIAYDIPGNRDVVRPGCGFLLPLASTSSATETIRALITSPHQVTQFGRGFRHFIQTGYSDAAYARRMDGLVRDLLLEPEITR